MDWIYRDTRYPRVTRTCHICGSRVYNNTIHRCIKTGTRTHKTRPGYHSPHSDWYQENR